MKHKPKVITIHTDKAEVEVVKFGAGSKDFVLIPGLSIKSLVTSAVSVAYAYKQFADEYTVYMILPRNNVSDGITVRDMADDVASVAKILNLHELYIAGMSMGGMIGQFLAIDYPKLVKKLVLCSSASRMNETSLRVMEKFTELAQKKDIVSLCTEFINCVYTEDFCKKYRDFIIYSHKDTTEAELKKFICFSSACKNMNSYDELAKIKCPMLVIGAEGDKALTGEASVEIAEKTNCELFMYGESFSHASYDEADDYKDRIKIFFDKE